MKLVMEVKEREQRIEHLELRSRELETDMQIGERKRQALEEDIERLKQQSKESERKERETGREVEKLSLENRNLRNQNEEKSIEMGKTDFRESTPTAPIAQEVESAEVPARKRASKHQGAHSKLQIEFQKDLMGKRDRRNQDY